MNGLTEFVGIWIKYRSTNEMHWTCVRKCLLHEAPEQVASWMKAPVHYDVEIRSEL